MPSRPAHKRKKKSKKKVLSPWWVAGVLGLVLLGVLLPHWLAGDGPETGAAVPGNYRHFVVDLSHNNPRKVQWDSLKVVLDRQGNTSRDIAGSRHILPLSHVVMKATEGLTHQDRHFQQWWDDAGAVGLSRGAYHFFRSSKDPAAQAKHYIGQVSLTHKDLPPILDIETVHGGCTREELNRKALQWLQAVEKHYGRRPIVYTGDSFAQEWLDADITARYPLWIARYNPQPPRTKDWKWWQFTDRAVVYGISGYVDLSVIP